MAHILELKNSSRFYSEVFCLGGSNMYSEVPSIQEQVKKNEQIAKKKMKQDAEGKPVYSTQDWRQSLV